MILSGPSIAARLPFQPFHATKQQIVTPDGFTLSYGLGNASYDVRLRHDADTSALVAGAFRLESTLERFRIPADCCAFVHDKSTLARRGMAVQNTFIDPGFEGYLTLELTNHGPDPIRMFGGMPICQIVFQRLDEPVPPYRGKYHDQPSRPVGPARHTEHKERDDDALDWRE